MSGHDRPAAASGAIRATLIYVVVTLAMTWPLAAGIARDVPGDLGDSLLNMWILAWGAEHVPAVLTGRMLPHDFWNANIFHPEPLALSFSEHLFGQVLQILPVYALTGNAILAYNLLFLSSFVLSGLGMYLLVRELIDDRSRFSWPAFVAGLIYAFVPFRIAQVAHIQSVSSQWMPLALYGFERFIRTRSRIALAGGTAALLMQNWSCGYYLIFFAPSAVFFVIHRVLASGRGRDVRVWLAFAVSAIVVAFGTWPFLTLYLEAQRVHGFERPLGEVIRFSADVYSYATAPEALRLWGSVLQVYPKPEGELFFGVVPWALALVSIVSVARLKPRPTTMAGPKVVGPGFSLALRGIRLILLVQLAGFMALILTGGFITSFGGIAIRATNPGRLFVGMSIATALLLALSPGSRQRARAALRSPLTLALVLALLAMWLSLGPRPQSYGRALQGLGLYGVLYDYVPGFDGLRAPARYAMIAALFLAVASGFGLHAIMRGVRQGQIIAGAVAAAFLIEAAFAPMTINATWGDSGVQPPANVEPASAAPAVYREIARMPDVRVIAELPFGDPAWELRYVYYAHVHWKPLINGYSGGFPQSYKVRAALLSRISEQGDAAWQALRDAGATHVIVHRRAFPSGQAAVAEVWLTSHGAHLLQQYGDDLLFALPVS